VNTNSFSKYCLQYSPIPTVVVRDYEKRKKKKDKRTHDPARQSYVSMLAATSGKHEGDSEASSLYEMGNSLSPDEEAHKVAAAIGLPARFDPTLKPFDVEQFLKERRELRPSSRTATPSPPPSPKPEAARLIAEPHAPPSTVGDSDDEVSEDDFETLSGEQIKQQQEQRAAEELVQKQRLHDMEVGEAAALKLNVDEDDDDDDDGSPVAAAEGGT